jgi:ABC-type transport system substrate-binding protein
MRALAFLPLVLMLGACSRSGDGTVAVAVIGEPSDLVAKGVRLAPPAELVRTATAQGLVRLDEAGQLIPGLAERWIVTADGMSYIFRIREFDLRGGKEVTARTVQRALAEAMKKLAGTTLGLDLAQVRDVRAMTGRVIEIRLRSPMPGFLQLLAQPELGIAIGDTPTGPMTMTTARDKSLALAAMPPEARGLPIQPDWAETVRGVRLTASDPRRAMRSFSDGEVALVLGGTLATLPLADVGPLSRGTVRLDSALGLFGLDVLHAEGFLATPTNREALALALDRAELIKPFNIAGWKPTTRVVAPGLPDDNGLVGERWQEIDLDARRAAARQRVAAWKASHGGRLELRLALPDGPGSDTLFAGLASQYATVGITLTRAKSGRAADLALRDRVARFAGARWFLNQFHCGMSAAVCSEDVDFLVQMAVKAQDPQEQANYLVNAENALAAFNAYIPIGAPIRWSLVRSGVVGFAENPWAVHPLFPLTRAPM